MKMIFGENNNNINNINNTNIIYYPIHLEDFDKYREILIKFRKQASIDLIFAYEYCRCDFDKRETYITQPLVINGETTINKPISKIIAAIIIDDLGVVIETSSFYLVAWDTDISPIINFYKIKQMLNKWILKRTKFSVYYVYSDNMSESYNGKNVFYMVDNDYYLATRNKCIIL